MKIVSKLLLSASTAFYILSSPVMAMDPQEGDKGKATAHPVPTVTVPQVPQQDQTKVAQGSSVSLGLHPSLSPLQNKLVTLATKRPPADPKKPIHWMALCLRPAELGIFPRVCKTFNQVSAHVSTWKVLLKKSGKPYDSDTEISPRRTFLSLLEPASGDPVAMRAFANFLVEGNLKKSATIYFNLVIFNSRFPKVIRLDTQIDKNSSGIWDDDELNPFGQSLLKQASANSLLPPARRERARLLPTRRFFELNFDNPSRLASNDTFFLAQGVALENDRAEALFYTGLQLYRYRQQQLPNSAEPCHRITPYLCFSKASQIPEVGLTTCARAHLYMAKIRVEHLTDEAMEVYGEAFVRESQKEWRNNLINDKTAAQFLRDASQNLHLFPFERQEALSALKQMGQQGRDPGENRGGQKPEGKENEKGES